MVRAAFHLSGLCHSPCSRVWNVSCVMCSWPWEAQKLLFRTVGWEINQVACFYDLRGPGSALGVVYFLEFHGWQESWSLGPVLGYDFGVGYFLSLDAVSKTKETIKWTVFSKEFILGLPFQREKESVVDTPGEHGRRRAQRLGHLEHVSNLRQQAEREFKWCSF